MSSIFSSLDWLIAWRHIRVGDERPVWVTPLLWGSIYLLLVGAGFSVYAAYSGGDVSGVLIDPSGTESDLGPTALQRYYGLFGGLTLLIGGMALLFGTLSWAFNLLATIITMSVLLGCMALVVVLSLMSGLEGDLRDKILDQKAHIRISRADARPLADYIRLADAVEAEPGIAGASPFLEGEIMVRSGLNRQAAVLTGILPRRQAKASNLEQLVRSGRYDYLERPEEIPDPDPFATIDGMPWRLRHLEDERRQGEEDAPDAVAPSGPSGESAGKESDEAGPGEPAGEPSLGPGIIQRLPPPPDGWEADPERAGGGPPEGWEDPTPLPSDRRPTEPALGEAVPPPEGGWEDPRTLTPGTPGGPPDQTEGSVGTSTGPGSMAEAEPVDDEGSEETGIVDPVLIGRELAMELGVRVGTRVQLITPVGRMTPAGRIPGVMAAKIGAIFYSGMYEYDRRNVYIPLSVAQAFLRVGDRVSGIEVKLHDIDDIDEGKARVSGVVDRLGLSEQLVVEDWRDLNRNLFSAMFLEKVAMFIALLFVVLVASFGILASNLMSVMEKSKEIAILKAMGSSDRAISRVFVAEGLCVGLLGSFGGISMGLALCWALDRFGFPLNESVYYIERLPVVVNPIEVALVGSAALVIVWLSSLYPARLASRMRPVDGLRQADQ